VGDVDFANVTYFIGCIDSGVKWFLGQFAELIKIN
jgi:hypothetical protein